MPEISTFRIKSAGQIEVCEYNNEKKPPKGGFKIYIFDIKRLFIK